MRLFISFLGTGNYTKCKYKFKNKLSQEVHYVQTASAGFFCKNYSQNDRILIFCTSAAELKHFSSLKSEFKASDLLEPELIQIPDGSSEEKLWDIFQIIMDNVSENDEIIFDITHSFRSLPMLMTILLQYLKVVKNISIKGVYYGAFEAKHEEISPIFDLTPFFSLYDWSQAINNFIKFGRTGSLAELTTAELLPVLKRAKGKDKTASALNNLMNAVNEYSENIFTCRGNDIVNFAYNKRIKENIQALKTEMIPPLKPIIEKIEYEFLDYNDSDILNGFNAVDWCIRHGLTQQGITLLQEVFITYLIKKWKLKDIIKNDLKSREFVSSLLTVKAHSKKKDQWRGNLIEYETMAWEIYNNMDFTLAASYDKLTQLRNDINHGGFIKNAKPNSIKNNLNKIYKELTNFIQ